MELELNENQCVTFKQAYEWSKLPKPKYIMFGRTSETKNGKEFFKPFIANKLILAAVLKTAGAFVLTVKGKAEYEANRAKYESIIVGFLYNGYTQYYMDVQGKDELVGKFRIDIYREPSLCTTVYFSIQAEYEKFITDHKFFCYSDFKIFEQARSKYNAKHY
jgi:hypothetical protein